VTRRGNGEGSVYRRESDGKWVGAVTLEAGGRRVIYGRTQRETREKLRDVLDEVEQGIVANGAQLTVAGYLETWGVATLTSRVKAGTMAPRTADSYRDTIALHIAPYVGRLRLRTLRPADLRHWLSRLQDAQQAPRCGQCARMRSQARIITRCERHQDVVLPPLSSRTVRYAHAVLRASLSDAVNDQLVARNVATLVVPPAQPSREQIPVRADEASRLLAAAAEDTLGVLWLTLLALGLRRGEALALRWGDLKLDAASVRISRSLQRLRDEPTQPGGPRRGQLVETRPKTIGSEAVLPLPAALVKALRGHQVRQRSQRLAAPFWADPELVFSTGIGTALEPRNVDRSWKALCARAEVRPLRIHDLRHATATFLLTAGVDMKVIQRTLRHSRHQTTADVYAHVAEELQRGAAEGMDAVLRQLRPGT